MNLMCNLFMAENGNMFEALDKELDALALVMLMRILFDIHW